MIIPVTENNFCSIFSTFIRLARIKLFNRAYFVPKAVYACIKVILENNGTVLAIKYFYSIILDSYELSISGYKNSRNRAVVRFPLKLKKISFIYIILLNLYLIK